MTEFYGGTIPVDQEAWTVAFGDGVFCEELDVLAPIGSTPDEVRAVAAPLIAADYLPGLRIFDVSPFRGVTVWGV